MEYQERNVNEDRVDLDSMLGQSDGAEEPYETPAEYWNAAADRVSPQEGCDVAMRVMPSFNKNLRQ